VSDGSTSDCAHTLHVHTQKARVLHPHSRLVCILSFTHKVCRSINHAVTLPAVSTADRLVKALTTQLYCVPESSGRSSTSRDAYAAGEKFLEAAITVFKQQQVS
jgi:hypothetical protein